MLGDLLSLYLTSLGEFWSSAIRIGLPQILLVVLLICWLRRRGCGKSRSKSCWFCCWCCGDVSGCTDGDCGDETDEAGSSCGAEDVGEADADQE
jgi:hypothetical protein